MRRLMIHVLALVLAAALLFMGVQKFDAANYIFEVISQRSGFAFTPQFRILTGVLEVMAGLLMILPRSRGAGALLATGIVVGAVLFHLSPWLGTSVAMSAEGEASLVLFMAALLLLALAVVNLYLHRAKVPFIGDQSTRRLTIHVLALALAEVMLFMGVQKFDASNYIFDVIAQRSGFAFTPQFRILTGVLEVMAGLLMILPRSRGAGALLATGIVVGALLFHLSPWLGISVAMSAESEASLTLFVMALLFLALAVINLYLHRAKVPFIGDRLSRLGTRPCSRP